MPTLCRPATRRLLVGAWVVVLCFGLQCRPAAGFSADPEKDLAHLDRLEIFQPGEPTILYSVRGEPFATLAPEYRIFVPLSGIPKLVREAVLDVEDAQFYQHGAISLKGMARAALRNLTLGKVREGGSTITQQLAKSLFLSPERTLSRKFKEIELAVEIERRYSKDKILEMYLNTIYFGGGAYGIEAAARTYFNKTVEQLSLPEAALLAGLPKAPSAYSPFNDLKRARERRNYVLKRMQEEGHITAAQARLAMARPVVLSPFFRVRGAAPYFVDYVRKELVAKYGPVQAMRGGLRVQTTLDLEMQRTAAEILRNGVRDVERTLAGKRKAGAPPLPGLEGALVALDPATGGIRAMVGGVDYNRSQFNRAVQAQRQPGSAFKPFVYATAFDRGYSPAGLLDDFPISYSIPQGDKLVEWSPENFDRQYRGLVTLRHALEDSINVPTVRLMEGVGVEPVIALAHRMGITSELRPELALALGVSEVNLLELTSAYGVLADRGIRVAPSGIGRILSPNGSVLETVAPFGERVLREGVAFIVTSILQGAVERGTAKRAKVPGWEVAAKTGTSQGADNVWLMGYTPTLVTGLWLGYDQPRSLGTYESAGRLAAPIWAEFMRAVLKGQTPQIEAIPESVFPAYVDYQTGAPAEAGSPDAIQEFFLRGDTTPAGTAGIPGPPLSPLPGTPQAPLPPVSQPLAPLPAGAGDR